MTVRLTPTSVVLRDVAGDAKIVRESRASVISSDAHLTALAFDGEADRLLFLAALREQGVECATAEHPQPWLELDRTEAWIAGSERDDVAEFRPVDRPPFQRLEILSRSESGLSYVRERKSGILRMLTEEELRDFNDPPPCVQCGEQFGCDHFNCAGEPLLNEDEIDADVPEEWRRFAREAGVSRQDLLRLRSIREAEGEYRVEPNAESDMRTMELVLLLNER
jgi:hypothetical protein